MSVRVGIYQLFARAIPGGFYLFTIFYLCVLFGLVTIDFQSLNNLSVIWAVVFAVLAYILGEILDQFALWWHRLFKPRNLSNVVLDEFKQAHAEWEINVQDRDWPILLAYLRQESLEVVNQLETHNATCIMLRNVGLNLMVLSIIQMVQFTQTSYIWNLVLCIVFGVLSIISGRQATKFKRWFYRGIFEALIACNLEISEIVKRKSDVVPEKVEGADNQSSDKQPVKQAK